MTTKLKARKYRTRPHAPLGYGASAARRGVGGIHIFDTLEEAIKVYDHQTES